MLIAEKNTYQKDYRSALFTQYNRAKVAARKGKLEIKRVHRAMGLAISETLTGTKRPYETTVKTCNCPDARRGHTCKHRIKEMLIQRANEQLTAERTPKSKIEIETESQAEFKVFMAEVTREQNELVKELR